MEGIWFYWFAWIGWIILTFFFKKDRLRTTLTSILLLILITAHHNIPILHTEVSLGFLVILVVNYCSIANFSYKKLAYLFIYTVILAFSYVSFHLFSIYDPVWVFFHPSFMVAIILTYLTLLLIKEKKERYILYLFGLSHGELLYGFIMDYHRFPITFGGLSFFDIFAIGATFISIWNGFELLSAALNQTLRKTNKRKAGIL
ncbi:YphA family membrane protein [Bacillus sp. AK128]